MMGAMDHNEVREILEDAAIEPDGLERLMAGDTPAASIVAGHLADCPDCAEELERLRRVVGVIRPAIHAVPPAELRERTLAYVAAVGRPRGAAASAAAAPSPTPTPVPTPTPLPTAPTPIGPSIAAVAAARDRRNRLGWLAGLAAALIVAVTGTALLVNAGHESTTRLLSAEIDALGDVTRWTLRVDAQPDVRRIQLASATGSQATGNLVYSPTSTDLVIVADGLPPAAAGQEYRCWVEVDGTRSRIGRMLFGGDLAYWVGKVQQVTGVPANAKFGVSLVQIGATDAPGEGILVSD